MSEMPPWVASWWRPIETAPKDGTFILAGWRGNPAVNRLHFYHGEWTDGASNDVYRQPTDWMPLPPPPAGPTPAAEGG